MHCLSRGVRHPRQAKQLLKTYYTPRGPSPPPMQALLVILLVLDDQLLWQPLFIVILIHGLHSNRPRESGKRLNRSFQWCLSRSQHPELSRSSDSE